MKNYMFMSKSERQERSDKRWQIATAVFGFMAIIYLFTAMFAMTKVQDNWAFVALGAVTCIGLVTCMFRDVSRRV